MKWLKKIYNQGKICFLAYPMYWVARIFGIKYKGGIMKENVDINSIETPKSNPDLDKLVDEVMAEVVAKETENISKDYEEQIKILQQIIEDCKKSKPYETPNLDIKVMIIEVLKTLNDQNRDEFNYHEKTIASLSRIETKQKEIDRKYTGRSIGFIVFATAIVTIVFWENKESILSLLEPIWKIIEPFLKITKGD